MESLKRTFFEDPTWVYVILAGVELVVLILWYKRRTRRAALRLLIPLAVAVMAFTVERAVVTLHEKLLVTLDALQRDAESMNVNGVAGYLAQDMQFVAGGRTVDKPAAVRMARAAIRRFGVSSVEFINHCVRMDDRRAKVTLSTRIIADGELGRESPFIVWQLRWRYGPNGWRIYHVAQPQVGLLLSAQ